MAINYGKFYGNMSAILFGLLLACFFTMKEQSDFNEQLVKDNDYLFDMTKQLTDSLRKCAVNDSTYSIHFNKLVKDYESRRRQNTNSRK